VIRKRRIQYQRAWATGLALVAWISIISSRSAAAKDAERDQKIRSLIEREIKTEFDNSLAALMKAAEARGKTNDAHKMELAVDGIKDMFYNKAYGLYRCVKEADGLKTSAAEKWDRMEACNKTTGLLIMKAYKIMSEYPSSLLGKWEVNCEFKALLFDAEIEFPPFDYLKTTATSNTLIDHNRLIDCFLSDDHR
jgi:hypothetical protein